MFPQLPEHQRLQVLMAQKDPLLQVEELTHLQIPHQTLSFPVLGFTLGKNDPSLPTLGLFGGVHGLERIGSHVVISFLEHVMSQLAWNEDLRWSLERCRIVAIPLINPVGMALGRRSNGNHVDLMRNAPVEALEPVPLLIGGQRLSRYLPYFRGTPGVMEPESQAVVNFVRKHCFGSGFSLCVDFHSGFGIRDQIWYPYAKTRAAFPQLRELETLFGELNRALPHHVYHIEPQSKVYLTHGDLWDHLHELHTLETSGRLFLPLTLEMGSWMWVKKNPLQLFNIFGLYNPVKPHRHKRIMRRHLSLMWFLFYAASNYQRWLRHSGKSS